MAHNDPSTKRRIAEAFKSGQDPADRLWAAIVALVLLIFVVGGLTVLYAESAREQMEYGRRTDFERGSVLCLTVVLDNDRTFDIPVYCTQPDVVVHFPPEVCEKFLSTDETCGTRWDKRW